MKWCFRYLKIEDKNSIGTNNNARPKEVFEGINKANIWNLCFWIQIKFIPTKIEVHRHNITTQHITTVKESKKKPQSTFNISELIQGISFTYSQEFSNDTS